MIRKFSRSLAAVLVVLLLAPPSFAGFSNTASASGVSGGGYVQDRFFLSTFRAAHWGDALDLNDYKAVIQATKEANFNLVENAIMPRGKMLQALAACEEVQIRCLAQNITNDLGFSGMGESYPTFTEATVQSAVYELKNFATLEGYYIWDEVFRPHFGVARQLKDYFKQQDPDRLVYSIALPSYGPYRWDDTTGNAYDDYIDEYIETVDPDVLGFDYYPFWNILGPNAEQASLIENDLWRDMGLFRQKSIETTKPFWFYFQAVDMAPVNETWVLGHMTPEKMGVQMKAALAYGAKTVSYFLTLDMLTDVHGNKMPIYNDIQALNKGVMNLGNKLFDKQSKKIYHFGIPTNKRQIYFLDDAADDELIQSAPDHSIVSVFADDTSTAYVLVVNKDYTQPLSGQLKLKVPGEVKLYDKTNDASQLLSGLTDTIDLQIAGGDAELYMIVPAEDTQVPAWPPESKLTAADAARTSVKLSWPEATDNVGVKGYRIYVDGAEKATAAKDERSRQIGDLNPGTTYTFAVKAYDAAGNESAELSVSATTLTSSSGGGGGSGGGGAATTPETQPQPKPESEQGEEQSEPTQQEPEKQPTAMFTDISTHWAIGAIKKAVEQQIVSGYPDGTFRPDQSITRAEFIVMLAKALGLDGEDDQLTFSDRERIGPWASRAIAQAVRQSVIQGYADGSFRPGAVVTRAEMATMIARALGLSLADNTSTGFADDGLIPAWAKSSVEAMRREGVVGGRSGERFAPHASASRAEAIVMLLRAAASK
ncbi:S-layer homology domain-containing protein [Cohnella sp.]|uniref:S-layer homology domain-containing protein n=1 Tax=Cohnella sp. TaxID=1883426 RepID=UPI003704C1D8